MSGDWSDAQVAAFLAESRIPLRLAVIDASGCPLVLSLWFLHDEGALWCATHASARVLAHLAREGRCGFEVAGDAPPYRGLRGRGAVSLHPERGGEMLERLLDRYAISRGSTLAGKLLARAEEEVAIRIVPERTSTWDFSRRMKDAAG